MKRIFTFLASLILTISLFATDRPKAMLSIKSYDQGDIRVIIDGRRFEPNDNQMRIQNIEPGYHNIKIYREKSSGFFPIFGNRYDVVFNNSIMIRPRTSMMITIDRYGRSSVEEYRMHGGGRWGDGDRDDDDWRRNNRDFDYNNGRNYGDYGNDDRNWDKRNRDWDNRDRDWNNGGRRRDYDRDNDRYEKDNDFRNNGYNNAMSDYDFSRVLEQISRERFENNMLKSATQIINTNYFTTTQVKQLLQLFSFEDNKLQLAKLAYDKTVDQRNYFTINDVFSYSSSRDELARYIRNH